MSTHHSFYPEKEPISRELRQLREELWGPIPPRERVQWSNALLDNPPTELTVMGNLANAQLLHRDGIVMNRQWVAVARYWDDLGVTAYEWLLQKGTLAPNISDSTPSQEDPWGDCAEEERRAWTAATLRFPPRFMGATVMALHDNHARKTGITNSSPWIELARDFKDAGFTPEEFIVLNTEVRKFHKRGMANALISTTWGRENVQFIRLDAPKWTQWLESYRSGEDSYILTEETLAPHWTNA